MPRERIEDLEALAQFARRFVQAYQRGGAFGLSGDLGAGKTSFVREVVKALATSAGTAPPRVTSPSYVLHQFYPLGPGVDHFDLYRLESLQVESLTDLGFFEATERAANGGYLFVEWPERLPSNIALEPLHFLMEPDGRYVEWKGRGR